MTMTAFSQFAVPARARIAALGLVLATFTLGACRDLTGDELGKTGAAEILVQDHTGAPVVDVTVSMSRKNDVLTHRTANNGVVRFDLVEAGDRQYIVRNPTGYTGGGDANAKTITVAEGAVAKATFTLTKLP
jgi:hypothetical protein